MEDQNPAPVTAPAPLSERLEFDFRRITAKDIAELNKAFRAADTEASAAIFARIITKCPPEWGAPNESETYLRLPYYGEFQDIISAMGEAAKNARRP